jgi:hypothetical protein
MTDPVHWGADVPVSLPQPLSDDNPGVIPMDGFCFTANGLFFDLSTADYQQMATPSYAPVQAKQQVVNYDEGL